MEIHPLDICLNLQSLIADLKRHCATVEMRYSTPSTIQAYNAVFDLNVFSDYGFTQNGCS